MRNTLLAFAVGICLALPVFGQQHLLSVLETEREVFVDTLMVKLVTTDTFPTPGFGGEAVVDTFDFGPWEAFPTSAAVIYQVEGNPMDPLVIEDLIEDQWYDLEGFDQPGHIKFLLKESAVLEGSDPVLLARIAAEPNPFRSRTTLRFELSAPCPAIATLFDKSGRALGPLLDARLTSGLHLVEWHGSDRHGRRLPSGVYLLQLRAGDAHRLVKLVMTN